MVMAQPKTINCMPRRVAVIGAGPSGLVAMKTILEEGHYVQGFEKSSCVGGMWDYDYHTDKQGEEEGFVNSRSMAYSIYNSLRLLTSSYSSVFSDYMPDNVLKNNDHFLTHRQFKNYIKCYAKHFHLYRHIRFSALVLKVTKCSLPDTVWKVTYQQGEDMKEDYFEFVFVASGPCNSPSWPKAEIVEKYQGVLVHSSQVRQESSLFKGKRVLVIGGGYSGGDMVTSAVKSRAEVVYWSISREHRNHWCFDRYIQGKNGKKPWDALTSRKQYMENRGEFWNLLKPVLKPLHSSGKNKIKPRIPGDAISVADTEFIDEAFVTGDIVKLPTISGVVHQGKCVELVDGTILRNIDVIVAATGFKKRFPYLDDIWSAGDQEMCQLFKHVLSPNKELDGIGFLTMATGPVSLFLVMEMQARWLCWRLLSRHYDSKGLLFSENERKEMFDNIPQTTSILDPYAYLDGLANDIGCLPPDPEKLLQISDQRDVQLSVALQHGPFTGAQYRLLKNKEDTNFDLSARETVIKVAKYILGDRYQEYVDDARKML